MGNKPVKALSASESSIISKQNGILSSKQLEKIDRDINRCFYKCMSRIERARNKGRTKRTLTYLLELIMLTILLHN